MVATTNSAAGQVVLADRGQPVLQYNYRTVEPGALSSLVSEGNQIYARARSDYIHPLHGPSGEVLTRDWSIDHPHHRGIYWAWPEVDFGTARGDLHALQIVFARPTGRLKLTSGSEFAQVEAENLWLWEDREPIVREWTLIRAYPATAEGRVVDLVFRFEALKEGVTLARRGTSAYGGLNVRLETPADQSISTRLDPPGVPSRAAWSDLSGQFQGATAPSGLAVFQHHDNPEYPGEWVQYPELSWCQPTFPTSGTRFALRPAVPLVLRYRLWTHTGGVLPEDRARALWEAWHRETGLPTPSFP